MCFRCNTVKTQCSVATCFNVISTREEVRQTLRDGYECDLIVDNKKAQHCVVFNARDELRVGPGRCVDCGGGNGLEGQNENPNHGGIGGPGHFLGRANPFGLRAGDAAPVANFLDVRAGDAAPPANPFALGGNVPAAPANPFALAGRPAANHFFGGGSSPFAAQQEPAANMLGMPARAVRGRPARPARRVPACPARLAAHPFGRNPPANPFDFGLPNPFNPPAGAGGAPRVNPFIPGLPNPVNAPGNAGGAAGANPQRFQFL